MKSEKLWVGLLLLALLAWNLKNLAGSWESVQVEMELLQTTGYRATVTPGEIHAREWLAENGFEYQGFQYDYLSLMSTDKMPFLHVEVLGTFEGLSTPEFPAGILVVEEAVILSGTCEVPEILEGMTYCKVCWEVKGFDGFAYVLEDVSFWLK